MLGQCDSFVNFIQPRVTLEENLNWGLSRSGSPVSMSMSGERANTKVAIYQELHTHPSPALKTHTEMKKITKWKSKFIAQEVRKQTN